MNDREAALLQVLRSERVRWAAVREYAHQTQDQALLDRMDQASSEYAERNRGVLPFDGWLWRPRAGDGRWQFRGSLEGRGFSRTAEVVPVMYADDWKPVFEVVPHLTGPEKRDIGFRP